MSLLQKVRSFPASAGVYLMKEDSGRVLYVGKAGNIRKRVRSYFGREERGRAQIRFLMARVADIECIVTDNEKEALLLENTLIKKYRPRYNLQLKDDKSYVSIKLSLPDRFPRISVTRKIRKDGSLSFGPYPSASAARETVDFIERHFRLRTCSDVEFRNRSRPCLQYQIHRCDAPCVGWIDEGNYQKLVQQVRLFLQGRKQELLKLLEDGMRRQSEGEEFEKAGQTRDLLVAIRETLERQKVARHAWWDQDVIGLYREGERLTFCLLMIREGKVWESRLFHLKGYEEDGEILGAFLTQFYGEDRPLPDEIVIPMRFPSQVAFQEILSERQGKRVGIVIPRRGDRYDLLGLALRNAREGLQRHTRQEEEIQEVLGRLQETLHLQEFPRRIECFDISNLGGREAVGSLVSFVEGIPSKEGYRRFRIKTVDQPDDFAMMREVLKRRLLRGQGWGAGGKEEKWEKPDLIVVDGGKGQLNVVLEVMKELEITGIDLVALAKAKEGEKVDKVYLPGRKNPILFPPHSSALHLLMRVRDEAHRFAIAYHRRLKEKSLLRRQGRQPISDHA